MPVKRQEREKEREKEREGGMERCSDACSDGYPLTSMYDTNVWECLRMP